MRVALAAALSLIVAAPAAAEVRVYDGGTGRATTVIRDDATRLLGWTDDGTGLVVSGRGRVWRVAVRGGTVTEHPWPREALSVGPGGRAVVPGVPDAELKAPDGRTVASFPLSWFDSGADARIAWSRDGRLVAVVARAGGDPRLPDPKRELVVFDTGSGAVVLRRGNVDGLGSQAFAPDGSALVVHSGRRVLRITLAGTVAVLYRARELWSDAVASWSPSGQVAIVHRRAIGVLGFPSVAIRADAVRSALWSGDGALLGYEFDAPSDGCSSPRTGVAVAEPARPPRTLVEPGLRELRALAWSPRGRTLAVDLGPEHTEHRGKRRPWPKRIARDFHMASARGDAAMRRIVVRASRALRRGAGREAVLSRVRLDFIEVDERHPEASDTMVGEKLASELDRWLIAAGYEPVEARDEVTC